MKLMIIFYLLLLQIVLYKCEVTFDGLIEELKKEMKMKKMAVAGGDNPETIEAARLAKDMKIGDSILIGNEEEIRKRAKENNIDISDFEIVNIDDKIEITRYAVNLINEGKADVLVKGSIQTKDILKVLLDTEIGFKTSELINLVGILEIEGKLTFLTDISIVPYPTLENKVQIINNAVKLANAVGIKNPKVGVIAGIAVPNSRMPETLEAEKLTKMNMIGEIKDCIVDGPLSLDLAISPESAQIKNVNRRINGDADIILFPDVHAANIAYKILTHMIDSKCGSILLGTKKPVILTSRSDSTLVKVNSMIFASLYDRLNKSK